MYNFFKAITRSGIKNLPVKKERAREWVSDGYILQGHEWLKEKYFVLLYNC